MSSVNNTAAVPSPEPANPRFSPSMAIIIVVLIGACLVVAIFLMYIRRCTQGDDENSSRIVARRNQSIHFYERPGEGLERAVLDSLPVVSFSVVKTLKNGKEDLECAVCLESFEEDESLRLLPKCSHVFHTECIDAWFLSHSTCPLCRTSLKPTTDELNAGVPAVGEVSRRILEAQEELFGSGRQGSDQDSIIDEDEVLHGKLMLCKFSLGNFTLEGSFIHLVCHSIVVGFNGNDINFKRQEGRKKKLLLINGSCCLGDCQIQ